MQYGGVYIYILYVLRVYTLERTRARAFLGNFNQYIYICTCVGTERKDGFAEKTGKNPKGKITRVFLFDLYIYIYGDARQRLIPSTIRRYLVNIA